jgi:hypothetical protein
MAARLPPSEWGVCQNEKLTRRANAIGRDLVDRFAQIVALVCG